MRTHLNAVQTAKIYILAVVSAAGYRTIDGRVRGAVAAVIGTISVHSDILLNIKIESGIKA